MLKKKNIILITVLATLAVLFAVIAAVALTDAVFELENSFYLRMVGIRTPALNVFVQVLVIQGMTPILIGIALIFELIKKTRHKFGFQTAAAVSIGFVTESLLKAVFRRPRPYYEYIVHGMGYSFPSGHATAAAAFFASLVIFFAFGVKNKRIKIPAIALFVFCTLVAAWGRVYLGAHWIADVLAGIVLGTFCAVAAAFIVWPLVGRILARIAEKYPKLQAVHTAFFGKPKDSGGGEVAC